MQVRAAVVSVVVSGAFFFACVGEDPALSLSDERADGGGGAGAADGSTDGGDDACATRCKDDDVLQDCAGNETRCALGCVAATNSCKALDPASAVDASELVLQASDVPIVLPSGEIPTTIDTSTGEMKQGDLVVRAANDDPTVSRIVANIGFVRRNGLAIFRARSWTLGNVYVKGAYPIAFVAPENIDVLGHVATECGKAGATDDGNGGEPLGGNDFWNGASGAGGGGNGTAGAAGGDATGDEVKLDGGKAGPVVTFSATNLRGGGNGGQRSGTSGGGGGAIVLTAGTQVNIGDGKQVSYRNPASVTVTVAKGINVGGCGGTAGDQAPAGGGGAGGTIIIEAPTVLLAANAGLAANGGGGGGTGAKGNDAQLSDAVALGGKAGSATCFMGGSGGDGATEKSPATPGSKGDISCSENQHAGGGGGGLGRIVIRTRTGAIDAKDMSIQSPKPTLEAL